MCIAIYSKVKMFWNWIRIVRLIQMLVDLRDVDGNGQYDALTDGLLLLRGMFGLTDSALIAGTVSSDALYSTSEEIQSQISLLGDLADIDGNGDIDALTDGLLTLRYLFGLEGDSLIAGVIAENATRSNATEIEVYLETLTPDIQ